MSANASVRRVLLVYPKFPPGHLVGYEFMAPLYPDRRAVMPPLGLLTIAACLPANWELRLIDENVSQLADSDLEWAEVVFLSGMHPQRHRLAELIERANCAGKLTVLGGPSASICPEYYPQADILHVGEIGDATDELCEYLRATTEKPVTQIVLTTDEKLPLDEHPMPAIRLIDVRHYLVMPLQFSVGCPHRCEFCDIPIIYGNRPRVKSPERVLCEMQAIYDAGFVGALLFVDDNLIANRVALRQLLPELISWQKVHNYAFPLTAEVTVELAGEPDILQGLRDARFTHLFFGIESIESDVLLAIAKRHNTRIPLVEAMHTIQQYGIEVLMGIIFGFDGDDESTGQRIADFIDETKATLVYFNLLAALPKTPLWKRMEKEGRLLPAADGDRQRSDQLLTCTTTNVQYRMPNEIVRQMMFETIRTVYSADAVYRRISWNAAHVYGKQRRGLPPIANWQQRKYLTRYTLGTMWRVFWRIGVRSADRRHFWRFFGTLWRLRLTGKIGSVLEILLRDAPHAYHLIEWGRYVTESSSSVRQSNDPSSSDNNTRPSATAMPSNTGVAGS